MLTGSGKLEEMRGCTADVLGLDWGVDMGVARQTLGAQRVVQGNVDPMVLFGSEAVIAAEVERCLRAAGPRGHILNVGHGVVQVINRLMRRALSLVFQSARVGLEFTRFESGAAGNAVCVWDIVGTHRSTHAPHPECGARSDRGDPLI